MNGADLRLLSCSWPRPNTFAIFEDGPRERVANVANARTGRPGSVAGAEFVRDLFPWRSPVEPLSSRSRAV
jgi:hypothetical protein